MLSSLLGVQETARTPLARAPPAARSVPGAMRPPPAGAACIHQQLKTKVKLNQLLDCIIFIIHFISSLFILSFILSVVSIIELGELGDQDDHNTIEHSDTMSRACLGKPSTYFQKLTQRKRNT